MKIAFDVDGTLYDNYPYFDKKIGEQPRTAIVEFLKELHMAGHYIIVWSGGGKEYASQRVRDLKIEKFVHQTCSKLQNDGTVDVCFDDQDVTLAKVNIKI